MKKSNLVLAFFRKIISTKKSVFNNYQLQNLLKISIVFRLLTTVNKNQISAHFKNVRLQ